MSVGLTLRLTGCEDWPVLQHMSFCGGADPMDRDLPHGLWCLDCSSDVALVELIGLYAVVI